MSFTYAPSKKGSLCPGWATPAWLVILTETEIGGGEKNKVSWTKVDDWNHSSTVGIASGNNASSWDHAKSWKHSRRDEHSDFIWSYTLSKIPFFFLSVSLLSIANIFVLVYFKNINSGHESHCSSQKCLWLCDIFTQRNYFWHSKISFLPASAKNSLIAYYAQHVLCLKKRKRKKWSLPQMISDRKKQQ